MSTPTDDTEQKIAETLAQMEAVLSQANDCIAAADQIFVTELGLTDRSHIRENMLNAPNLTPDQAEQMRKDFAAVDEEIRAIESDFKKISAPEKKVVRPRRGMMRI
ncbi:hypothetical protein DB346_23475 [Verrucomicrobia bacterium LW23]|nr:hypothetical protein DB346_23475 [Verrucomicrobia bacterium LW23]